jgi:putative sigma-54 modulation protein
MKIHIQGKQLKVPEELKSYVAERLVAPLTRFYDNSAAELRVEFGDTNGPKGGEDKECHLTLHMPGGNTLQIEETTRDAYASLDAASERLVRACKRELSRMRLRAGHRREHPLASAVVEGAAPGGLVEDLPDSEELSIAEADVEE